MSAVAQILSRPDLPDRADRDAPNILKTLLAIQSEVGHVPPASVPEIAAALGVTDAEVAGVLSFYPDLRTSAPGRHVVRVCQGESCVANHCGRVLKEFEKKLGVSLGETTRDGRFTLEKVYCAGNCAAAPTVMIGEDVHGRVTPEKVGTLLKDCR
ncbi:MAG: NAD(P)H-dependent oxidoreductase subunit E [Nitrospirae bacterium]|nr:MAG: NAD(P)H-dependent oxidoreductase subunit E [Nitrospirota bacterium]